MLQAWFGLLDIGMTPTVARETARNRAGATSAVDFRRLVRALTLIFVAVALVGAGGLLLSANYISDNWLQANSLHREEVLHAIQLMALGIGLRWMSGLARGRITGAEEIVWLSGFNALIATLRFVGVIPILIWIDSTPITFFLFQLAVAILEFCGLTLKAHGLLPVLNPGTRIGWSLAPIRGVLKFSLAIAFTSSIWIVVTQSDKLILSKLLSLQDYGYFTLAVVVAGSVLIATGPISTVLIPRLTHMEAQGDAASVIDAYRRATRLVSLMAMPVAFVLAMFAVPVLWAWTGDMDAAQKIGPVAGLYAIGNALLAVGAFPAYLQYARGNLRLHLIGSGLFIGVLLPALILGVWQLGATGAGWAWLGTNLLYLLVWVPFVHSRLAPGLHLHWLARDVLPATAIAALCTLLGGEWISVSTTSRIQAVLWPFAVGFVVFAMSALPLIRSFFLDRKAAAPL